MYCAIAVHQWGTTVTLLLTAIHAGSRLATPESEEKQSLAREYWSVLIKDFIDAEGLLGRLDKVHIRSSSFLEAEVYHGLCVDLK